MSLITIIISIAGAMGIIYAISRIASKREKMKLQAMKDLEIERYVFKKGMSELVKHSNHEYLAHIIATRITELMEYGISPRKLYNLMEKLGIETIAIGPVSAEELLRSRIQGLMIERIDRHDLQCWVIHNKAEKNDWEKINTTFLTKAKPNGFIMDLQLN